MWHRNRKKDNRHTSRGDFSHTSSSMSVSPRPSSFSFHPFLPPPRPPSFQLRRRAFDVTGCYYLTQLCPGLLVIDRCFAPALKSKWGSGWDMRRRKRERKGRGRVRCATQITEIRAFSVFHPCTATERILYILSPESFLEKKKRYLRELFS